MPASHGTLARGRARRAPAPSRAQRAERTAAAQGTGARGGVPGPTPTRGARGRRDRHARTPGTSRPGRGRAQRPCAPAPRSSTRRRSWTATGAGGADFLERVDRPTALGAWGYEPVDAKLARAEKPTYVVQLCFYGEAIARVQGVAPEQMHVLLGIGERRTLRYTDFAAYYRRLRRGFEAAIGRAERDRALPRRALRAVRVSRGLRRALAGRGPPGPGGGNAPGPGAPAQGRGPAHAGGTGRGGARRRASSAWRRARSRRSATRPGSS